MPKKSFLSKLEKGDTPSRGLGLIAIKACEEDIKIGLESGYTLKQIHTALVADDRMPIGYPMFQRHVKKVIKQEESSIKNNENQVVKNTKKNQTVAAANKVKFNPHSSDDMDKFV